MFANLSSVSTILWDIDSWFHQSKIQEKFQTLLHDLFEFDCADLDFGIYRIMNHKREIIRQFIDKNLPEVIAEELQRDALAEQGQAQEALAATRRKVLEALSEDALDASSNLTEAYHGWGWMCRRAGGMSHQDTKTRSKIAVSPCENTYLVYR